MAQVTPTLRQLALDACRYEDNDYDKDVCVTSGRLKPATIDFLREQTVKKGSYQANIIQNKDFVDKL